MKSSNGYIMINSIQRCRVPVTSMLSHNTQASNSIDFLQLLSAVTNIILTTHISIISAAFTQAKSLHDRPGISFFGLFTVGKTSVLTVSNLQTAPNVPCGNYNNTLRPRRNGRHCQSYFLRCLFLRIQLTIFQRWSK